MFSSLILFPLLHPAGYTIVPDFDVKYLAHNGKDIVKQIEKNHAIDVILMDIDMPVMNGIDLIKKIKDLETKQKELEQMIQLVPESNNKEEHRQQFKSGLEETGITGESQEKYLQY